jgi:hypothetical protein
MKKRLKYLLLLLVLQFLWPAILHAQTIETTARSLTSCPSEILVPIDVTNFNQVGAISLVLNYNDQLLSYKGYENAHSELSGGMLIVNANAGSVIIVWTKQSGANIGEGTLMQLRFLAGPGLSTLNWDTQTPGNCEYGHINGTTMPATFINGQADIQSAPQINIQPLDKLVLEDQNISFTVNATGTNLAYSWYQSVDNGLNWQMLSNGDGFSGVSTHTLIISNVPIAYNGYLYRCELSGTCPSVLSTEPALLTVVKPLVTFFDISSICPGEVPIPVMTEEFNNVAAFSLSFNYNPDLITYTGYRGLNPALQEGEFVLNAENGTLYMSWASTTAKSFGTNKQLVELLFEGATGTVNLNWNSDITGQCEYVLLDGQKIISVFQNKSFNVLLPPTISKQPTARTIAEMTNTTFGVEAQATDIKYRWQVSTDNGQTFADINNGEFYAGATTTTLTLNNSNLTLSGNYYRCVITGTCNPELVSEAVLLTVLPKITTRLKAIAECPENTLVMPVNVERFVGVSSMSISFTYNDVLLTFKGYQSLNSNLANDNFVANAIGGKVYLTWYNTEEVTIGNDLLVELLFDGASGTSNLVWDTQTQGQCEYTNAEGTVIFTDFINGSVTVNLTTAITADPQNKSIHDGGSVSFAVGASGTSLTYLWQVSSDGGQNWTDLSTTYPYSGVTTKTMTINPANTNLNAFQYRCRVTGACEPVTYSTAATLTVTAAAINTALSPIVNSCTTNIDVPIMVTNCNNVGGISLTLSFDQSKLSFDGYHSQHSELNSGYLVVNQSENKVIMSWASLQAANIGSGQLLTYRFKAQPGVSTSLTWDTQSQESCEYSDIQGNLITAFFNNGNISVVANPLRVNAGTDVTINKDESVQLEGLAEGGVEPFVYNWTPETSLDNPGISGPIASPEVNTTYTLTVTAGNNCSAYDQVDVVVLGSCSTPSNLSAFKVTSSTIDLQWISQGAENSWDLLYGAQNFNPESGGTLIGQLSQRTHQVEGLSANTSYDFYVRARCSQDILSDWAGPITVTTQGSDAGFFIITATAGNNGMIEPSGEVEVTSGSEQGFVITPNDGYYITDVLVNGQSIGAVDEYLFENVTQDHSIQASFASITHHIALNTGWNIISSTVIPSDLNLKNIFQPLIDSGKLRKVMNESGKSIEDLGSFLGGWNNNIGDLLNTDGYKVNVTADCELQMEGAPVEMPFVIPLNAGWNIISFPTSGNQDGKAVVQSLIDQGKLRKVMDETGQSIEDLGSFLGGWNNSIGDLEPGKGYKVNVSAACELTISNDLSKSALVVPERLASAYFRPAFEGNGTDHMNIYLVELAENGFNAGDQIGVFDGETCVGSATIGNGQMTRNYLSIPVSRNDGLSSLPNGYCDGNPIAIRLYRNDLESVLDFAALNNTTTCFEHGETLIASAKNKSGILRMDENVLTIKCYPVPSSQIVNIDLKTTKRMQVRVAVYDALGRLVNTLYDGMAAGELQLQWTGDNMEGNSVKQGFYFCQINEKTVKIILK